MRLRQCKKAITFLFVSLCASLLFCLEKKTIRVGIIEFPGFCYRGTDNEYRGIDVETTYKIAQNANLDVEIVPMVYSASVLIDALEKGEIDVLCDMVHTPARLRKYLFSEQEVGHSYNSVYVRSDDNRLAYGDIEQLKKMTFGCEGSVATKEMFITWCNDHGFTPTMKYYPDYTETNDALEHGEIDAAIVGSEVVEGYRIIQKFVPTSYYYMFTKDNFELKNRFDTAMEQILQKDSFYQQKVYNKYMAQMAIGMEAFTTEEKAYIQNHPTIKVAIWKNDPPYFHTSQGKLKGIIPSYYTYLSNRINIDFTFVEYDTQRLATKSVQSGECDILGLCADDIITSSLNKLLLTESYMTINGAEVSKVSKGRSTDVAVTEKNEPKIDERFKQNNSIISIYICSTTDECFEKLERNRVDAVITSIPAAVWHINQHNISQYRLSALPEINWNICGAVNGNNSLLCSILDKAILVSESQMQSIISANTMQEETLRSSIERVPPFALAVVALILTALIIGMIIAYILLHRRHLEAAALERTKQDNEHKEQQLAAIEKSTEEKNIFFSNISHDMRTPLNAVIGFSELAMKEPVNEKTSDYLSKIQTSGKLLLELINDTLTISKSNNGKLKLNVAPVSTESLFSSIVVPIREIAEKKHIAFSVDLTEMRHRTILADELNLQKIFLNLLTNSVKYTPEGGNVFFKVHVEKDAPLDTVVYVQDNGIGMSKDFIPHMFEPFSQEHRNKANGKSGYDSSTSGTGLGLSIVKRLVDLMGGTITVESEVNKGTTFTVCLHFEDAPQSAVSVETEDVTNNQTTLAGKKVLVCEDNALNREIIKAILEEWNITVVTAEDGKVGVESFASCSEGSCSAILMDLRMPEMNGYEATKAIRAMKRSDASTVPVIALTADAFDDDAQKCYACGMNAHVSKPVDQQKLHDLLCKFIK